MLVCLCASARTAVGGLRLFLALALLSMTVSCTPQNEPSNSAWIDSEPQELFRVGEFFEEVWRSDLAEPAARLTWQLSGVETRLGRVPSVVRLVPGGRNSHLTRDVNFRASDIDEIRVEAAGLIDGRMVLQWPNSDGAFRSQLRLKPSGLRHRAASQFVFDVASHSEWLGRIPRIRIYPTTQDNEVISIGTVRAVKRRVPRDAWPRLTAGAWKVRLAEEQRDALVVPTGGEIERRFSVPKGARFSFAIGSVVAVDYPVLCTVWLESAGRRSSVFEQLLAPAESLSETGSTPPSWQRHVVDLADWGGREVTFSLEVSKVDGSSEDEGGALVAWANPRIDSAAESSLPNVVLISLDTLRADRLSLYGNPRATSPHLDRWAETSAVVFENAVATSPWTLPSHTSLFTGLDSLRHGVNYDLPAPRSLDTLAERLRAVGYRTHAVTGGGYLDPEFGLMQGFERVHALDERKSDGELTEKVARAIRWLGEDSSVPTFLFFHTYEIHSPFRARQPYYTEFGGDPKLVGYKAVRSVKKPTTVEDAYRSRSEYWVEGRSMESSDWQEVHRRYDAGIAYTDAQIAPLLKNLEQLDANEETLVIITSDHGEGLGEKGLAAHAYLYDFNLMVPLIVRLPGGRGGGRRVVEQVSLVDVAPTVLDLLGIGGVGGEQEASGPNAHNFDGRSLARFVDGNVSDWPGDAWSYAGSTNWGLALRRQGQTKYIYNDSVWIDERQREELYDLGKDALEENNLAAVGVVAAELREAAEAKLAASNVLRVRWHNAESRRVELTLRGPALTVARVKTQRGTADATFRYGAGNLVHWGLTADGSQELRFEGYGGEYLDLYVEDVSTDVYHVDLTGQTGPLRLELVDGEIIDWRDDPALPVEGRSLIELVPALREQQRQATIDDELADQLEALGYLQ